MRQNLPNNIQRPVEQVAANSWFERLARLGFAAKGTVYFVVGLLAAQAALGIGGKTTSTQGALAEIVTQPFGKFLLVIVAIGLLGYGLWRLVQAIVDPEHRGEKISAKRVAQRLGYALSGLAYVGLSFTAAKLILGSGNTGRGDSTQDWTARFLAQPFGQWLVGLAGLTVVVIGGTYLYQAYKATFRRKFNLSRMSHSEQTWAIRLGRFGIAARGIVFGVIGIFLIQAALSSNAGKARGFDGALEALAQQPFGPWILGLVALGLIAYSIYSIVEARYRQFAH